MICIAWDGIANFQRWLACHLNNYPAPYHLDASIACISTVKFLEVFSTFLVICRPSHSLSTPRFGGNDGKMEVNNAVHKELIEPLGSFKTSTIAGWSDFICNSFLALRKNGLGNSFSTHNKHIWEVKKWWHNDSSWVIAPEQCYALPRTTSLSVKQAGFQKRSVLFTVPMHRAQPKLSQQHIANQAITVRNVLLMLIVIFQEEKKLILTGAGQHWVVLPWHWALPELPCTACCSAAWAPCPSCSEQRVSLNASYQLHSFSSVASYG